MIGSNLSSISPWSYHLPQYPYHSVVTNDSDEHIDEEKARHNASTGFGSRWKLWTALATFCGMVILAGSMGSRLLRAAQKPPSFTPAFRTQTAVFQQSELFGAPASDESNAAWDSLIPDGHGYVLVPHAAEKYGLKPGIRTNDGPDRYSISMYHQIHCLGMIRIIYYDMLHQVQQISASQKRQHEHTSPAEERISSSHPQHDSKTSNESQPIHNHPGVDSDHIAHCFDYLRQALVCAGDMTIEHSREPPLGEKRITTDGWGVEHQCKNWDDLVAWTLNHKANHTLTGILGRV